VDRHQLTLQVGAELGDLDAVGAGDPGELVAVGLRRRRLLQVDQPAVPRRQLNALEAVAGAHFVIASHELNGACSAPNCAR
jgi:hypothetical protein